MKEEIGFYKLGGGVLNSSQSYSDFIPNSISKMSPVPSRLGAASRVYIISAFGNTTSIIQCILDLLKQQKRSAHRNQEIEKCVQRVVEVVVAVTRYPISQGGYYNRDRQVHFFKELVGKLSNTESKPTVDEQAALLQYGELIASHTVYDYMKVIMSHAGNVHYVDPRGIIKTSPTSPLSAEVEFKITQDNFDKAFAKIKPAAGKDALVVVPGFIASSRGKDSKPTLLGLEGSDFTAAILTNAAYRSSLDYANVDLTFLKNDPGISLNYKDGDSANKFEPEVTWTQVRTKVGNGDKVLHPKVIEIMEKLPIAVRVTNLKWFSSGHDHERISTLIRGV